MHAVERLEDLRPLIGQILRLRFQARVRVLYTDYALLEGTVIATHEAHELPGRSLHFTIRTDDERDLELDVLDVRAIHELADAATLEPGHHPTAKRPLP